MISVANRSRLAQRLGDVVTMFGRLLGEARGIGHSLKDQVSTRLKTVPPYLRSLASDIYSGQFLSDKTQLRRLLKKSASLEDQTILAEATCLWESYCKSTPTRMFLASTDFLFSPMLNEDGTVKSDVITREIKHKFSVECDWPDRIAKELELLEKKTK